MEENYFGGEVLFPYEPSPNCYVRCATGINNGMWFSFF